MDNIKTLSKWIKSAKKTVFFGGAGVSTESGIPDFRSVDGLYNQKYDFPPERILSHGFFLENPREFYRFYYEKIIGFDAKPSRPHKFLADWESRGLISSIVTQNIDGLHFEAGSRRVFELHGTTQSNRCVECGKTYPTDYIRKNAPLPQCSCGGVIKPDVVLYGEPLDGRVVEGAIAEIRSCDLLIVGGTSLSVYPAAGFVELRGGRLAVVNRDPTPADARADLVVSGRSIGDVFSQLSL